MHFIDTSDIHGLCMIPALSRSKCYIKVTDTLAIPDGIIFDFYPGLAHMYTFLIESMV